MKIVADFDKCQGLGMCESLAPNYFEVNDEGMLNIASVEVDPADEADVTEAVNSCPTEALRLEA